MFKVPSLQLRGILTADTLQFYILRTWIKMRAWIKTLVNATETKIYEGAGKNISCAKIQLRSALSLKPSF